MAQMKVVAALLMVPPFAVLSLQRFRCEDKGEEDIYL